MLVELGVAVLIDDTSMVTSTVPVFAARSSTTVPLLLLNLPRHVDTPPKWSASKLGYVWFGSSWYVSAAIALKDRPAASMPAAIIESLFKCFS